MASESEILEALQFPVFDTSAPINGTDDAPMTITYSFAGNAAPSDLPTSYSYGGWTGFTEAEKNRIQDALDIYESVLNVNFVEVASSTSDPDINFGLVDMPYNVLGHGGYSVSYSGSIITRWDGFALYDSDFDMINGDFGVILHEIGHAMGLKHSHEDTTLTGALETTKYSVMSYILNGDTLAVGETLGVFDVFALQDIWGASAQATDDTVYTGPTNDVLDLIWDTGGIDTLSAGDSDEAVVLSLAEGSFSQFHGYDDLVIAYGSTIENAIGSRFSDWITGNDTANDVMGWGGADLIYGEGGNDEIRGHGGNDYLNGGDGNDSLYGGADNDDLYGGAGNDWLAGHGGDDELYGGAGNDRMFADWGDDTLDGGAGDDRVFGGDGHDLVAGGDGADLLFGGAGNDLLAGGTGDDELTGEAGEDVLYGGDGSDRFVFELGSEIDVIKDFEAGIDEIKFNDLGSLNDIAASASETGGNVVFSFDSGDALTVENVTLSEILLDLWD